MDPVMVTLGILLVGVLVVVGGILALKLHPFLALVLGALAVGALTPQNAIDRHLLEKEQIPIASHADDTLTLKGGLKNGLRPGSRLLLLQSADSFAPYEEVAELEIVSADEKQSVVQFAGAEAPASLGPQALVITPEAARRAFTQARQSVPARVARGFGNTSANIGILIAMASIVGKCLLDSGAADRIVRFALRLLGERGAPLAFLTSGFVLAIPVFFDTVFYLMIPLGKALRTRTGRNYLLYVLTIVAGGTMAHSLVPPTPGPLYAAEALNVDLGVMIIAGGIVGLFSSFSGFMFASYMNRRMDVPLRETPDFSMQDLIAAAERDDRELPPIWLSLLPILLPVVLIGGQAFVGLYADSLSPALVSLLATLGDKNIALLLAAAIALVTLMWQKGASLGELQPAVQNAIASAGSIILITSAGGAFGGVLQQTGVATLIQDLPAASPPMVVTLAFLVTMAIRTAQGSATVAMITAVGILGGLASSGELGFHPVYLALAIGCGSKPVAWMNDSGFWVISKMSGMTEGEMLRTVTPMSVIMGVTGLIVTAAGAFAFPTLGL